MSLPPLDELPRPAWGLRARVREKVLRRRGDQHAQVLWKASLADVKAGFLLGPYACELDVTRESSVPARGLPCRGFWWSKERCVLWMMLPGAEQTPAQP